jgi:protein-disulfide isomerase
VSIGTGNSRPSKNERRDAAREKARLMREEQKKKDRRNKFILQGSLIVVVLAIIAAVVLVITSTMRPPAPGPLNMLSDGIKIGDGFHAVRTAALQPSEEPIPNASNEPSSILDIRLYVDYMCPICGNFEKANADQIKKLVQDGAATVEIHPVAILDRASMGTKYSTRAANAAACVANFSPDNFFDFSALLFQNQPEENSPGLDDDTIIGLAKEAGVSKFTNISSCITDQTFKNWVAAATDRFNSEPFPNAATQPPQHGTPTVYVNGQLYQYTFDKATGAFDPNEFSAFLTKVLGADFSDNSTPSPEPSPSGSPSPSK